jgi:hypothetical protein
LCSAKAAGEVIAIAARLAQLQGHGEVTEILPASMISHLTGKRIIANAKTNTAAVKNPTHSKSMMHPKKT